MRILLVALASSLLFACPTQQGPQGPEGAQGAPGLQGPQGPQGEKGDKGDRGEVLILDGGVVTGPKGDPGANAVVQSLPVGDPACPTGGVRVSIDGGATAVACNGAPGAAGAAGAAGPQGASGASVTVTVLASGSAACPTGGVRVTQQSDGGVSTVCNGAAGPAGATGATGATGAAGAAGAAGATGAAGASVAVVALSTGDANCPTGGARVTQLSDGGVSYVCSGAAGAAGAPGAAGATGAAGAAGAAGPGVAVVALGAGDANCPTGGARVTQLSDGGVSYVCNGAAGATGAAGAAGAPGAPGAQGPAGPPGPAGAVLYLDGGVALLGAGRAAFAGFTSATYSGNLGGRVGAHAICAAAFAGSVFCTEEEYIEANSPIPVPAGGVWVDNWDDSQPAERGYSTICSYWTQGNTSWEGTIINTSGVQTTSYVNSSNYGCGTLRPVACCFQARPQRFRGFTPGTYTGNLGGRVGAHALCNAAFTGSHFCHEEEYLASSSGAAIPAGGVWVDNWDSTQPGARGYSTICSYWTQGNTSWEGTIINTSGVQSTSYVNSSNYGCGTLRPLACCD